MAEGAAAVDQVPNSSAATAAGALSARDAAQPKPLRGPPVSRERAPAGSTADSAEMILRLAEDHDRIAQGLNDIVVHRLFAAGLDLQAALGLLGDHRAATKIYHAIGELDQAVVDLRDSIFGRNPLPVTP